MKTTGILFQADMVRSVLAGTKTLTSRLSGLDEINKDPDQWRYCGVNTDGAHLFDNQVQEDMTVIHCPYGGPGDMLIGRETWAKHQENDSTIYRSDRGGDYQDSDQGLFRWRPSIHMPFTRSRLRLKITRIWCSRIQDMTEKMANKEGCPSYVSVWTSMPALADYAAIWDRINSAKPGRSWSENPWVWRIEFKRIKP